VDLTVARGIIVIEALMPQLDVLSVVFAFVQFWVPRCCPLREKKEMKKIMSAARCALLVRHLSS
jgi:hypothetical protein